MGFMPTLIQINVTANWGSTGKIAESIGENAIQKGWNSYVVYGRMNNPSTSKTKKVGSMFAVGFHYIGHFLFDKEGLGSKAATKKLVEYIKDKKPDIIQLHNIHDHWLNYKVLFGYLNKTNIKVVWTFHDFWAITGHCTHFITKKCEKFIEECNDCPFTQGKIFPLIKQSKRNFYLKKSLFESNKNLTIVPVSKWVDSYVRQSFLKDKEIRVIPNGIDTTIFKPTYNNLDSLDSFLGSNEFIIMAVSSQWKSDSKGLNDYIAMSKMLKSDERIVLVGVNDDIISSLPHNIIGVKRTNNQQELASLYTRANVICSFSLAETFGLTIIEGYACGTPAVVYDNTAPPSLISQETGFVVPNKDYEAAYEAIQKIKNTGKKHYSDACIQFVQENYSKERSCNEYITLYEELLKK